MPEVKLELKRPMKLEDRNIKPEPMNLANRKYEPDPMLEDLYKSEIKAQAKTEDSLEARVADALREKASGSFSVAFGNLIDTLTYEANLTAVEFFASAEPLLQAIQNNVARMTVRHKELLETVGNMPWDRIANNTTVDRLLDSLVSAHIFALEPILRRLLESWSSCPTSLVNPCSVDERAIISERSHTLLDRILAIAPNALNTIIAIIPYCTPNASESLETHQVFMENILAALNRHPRMQGSIINAIVHTILQIDVKLNAERAALEALTDEEPDQNAMCEDTHGDTSDTEEMTIVPPNENSNRPFINVNSECDSDDDGGEDEDEVQTSRGVMEREWLVNDLTCKVDNIMMRMLTYCKQCLKPAKCDVQPKSELEPRDMLGFSLLHAFDRQIVHTHRCHSAQFLLFYYASEHAVFKDRLLGYLLEKSFDSRQSQLTRCTAAAYLGSLVARGSFVTIEEVSTALFICADWLAVYADEYQLSAAQCAPLEAGRHAPFYAIAQAAMYIFAFRWRELVGENDQNKGMRWWHHRGSFENVLFSDLEPLRICSKKVAEVFATTTRNLQLVFLDAYIISRERQSGLNTSLESIDRDEKKLQQTEQRLSVQQIKTLLEDFFPFDPADLELSNVYLEKLFVMYKAPNEDDLHHLTGVLESGIVEDVLD